MPFPKIDISVYSSVLKVRAAWRFDIAAILMRCLQYMFTLGSMAMMTLSGYSAFIAGSLAATICLTSFLVTPRIARLIDTRGQNAIVPWATLVTCAGVALMSVAVLLQAPLWLIYVGGVLTGCTPNAPSLARTRWTYLVETGQYGAEALDIRTVYSYEGILEDIVFTLSPAISVALAAGIHPIAGMIFGGACLAAGTILLQTATATQPQPGWENTVAHTDTPKGAEGAAAAARDARFAAQNSPWTKHPERSALRLSPTVRVLFICMVLLGIFYGSFDSATVNYCEEIGRAALASPVAMIDGIISAIAGMIFGTLKFNKKPSQILLVTAICIGVGYFTNIFVFNVLTMFLFTAIAAPFYAPFFITCNTVCERAIPSARLTEGIATINAGSTLGFAIGPIVCGILIDAFGGLVGFKVVGFTAILIPVVILLRLPQLRSELDN